MLSLQSFLRKGVSLGHVGSIQNLKDLKDLAVIRSQGLANYFFLQRVPLHCNGSHVAPVETPYPLITLRLFTLEPSFFREILCDIKLYQPLVNL